MAIETRLWSWTQIFSIDMDESELLASYAKFIEFDLTPSYTLGSGQPVLL